MKNRYGIATIYGGERQLLYTRYSSLKAAVDFANKWYREFPGTVEVVDFCKNRAVVYQPTF